MTRLRSFLPPASVASDRFAGAPGSGSYGSLPLNDSLRSPSSPVIHRS